MSKAAEAYTTSVVRLERAASAPVKQPRLFRRYRDEQDIPYLHFEKHRRRREREEQLKADNPVYKSEILMEVVAALLLAIPDEQRRAVESTLWQRVRGDNMEPQAVMRREAARLGRALVMNPKEIVERDI
jgi:hypothetical protein